MKDPGERLEREGFGTLYNSMSTNPDLDPKAQHQDKRMQLDLPCPSGANFDLDLLHHDSTGLSVLQTLLPTQQLVIRSRHGVAVGLHQ